MDLASYILISGYPQQIGRAKCLNQAINSCVKTRLNSAKLLSLLLGFLPFNVLKVTKLK